MGRKDNNKAFSPQKKIRYQSGQSMRPQAILTPAAFGGWNPHRYRRRKIICTAFAKKDTISIWPKQEATGNFDICCHMDGIDNNVPVVEKCGSVRWVPYFEFTSVVDGNFTFDFTFLKKSPREKEKSAQNVKIESLTTIRINNSLVYGHY